jgi:opacity protein-like surface antigen
MKNLKRILLATALLLSASSMAKLVQPLNPVGEDSPFRVSLAAKGGFGANKSREFGPSGLGGGIGFTHNVGYNVEYGLGLAYDWTSPTGRIFAQNSKATEGNRIDTELFVRYMPELAERFNLGLGASFGWGRQFGQGAKVLNDGMKLRLF